MFKWRWIKAAELILFMTVFIYYTSIILFTPYNNDRSTGNGRFSRLNEQQNQFFQNVPRAPGAETFEQPEDSLDRVGMEEQQPVQESRHTEPEKAVETELETLPENNEAAEPELPDRPDTDVANKLAGQTTCYSAVKKELLDAESSFKGNTIHFLLLARKKESRYLDKIILVSLFEKSHAILTTLSPDIIVEYEGSQSCRIDELPSRSNHHFLIDAVEMLTGLKPQFLIELRTEGFVKMVELLDGIEHDGGNKIYGKDILNILQDPKRPLLEKERLLIAMLVTARDVDSTATGLQLLWAGYRNLKTNLSISDLLDLRQVSQNISPYAVLYRQIDTGPFCRHTY